MSHNSPFTVAGMASSSTTHHAPNLNSWGTASTTNPLGSSFADGISQSRSHYQSGYLMSTSTNANAQQGAQRPDEVPTVQTKAKMNQILTRGTASDFGMESMFKSTRQRQTLVDEDAPPTSSINDIPNEINYDSPSTFQPKKSTFDLSPFASSIAKRHTQSPSVAQNSQPIYIVVFGYPPDKYSVTVEYFKSLGDSTEPDPNVELVNCFRIGYRDPSDALRAARKNGEILGGSWMVGTKWADPNQAEAFLGQSLNRTIIGSPLNETYTPVSNDMAVDPPSIQQSTSTGSSLGTPLKLAPSGAAFRKPLPSGTVKPATPQSHQKTWSSTILPASASTPSAATQAQNSPSKGMIGQVSDLIFGW